MSGISGVTGDLEQQLALLNQSLSANQDEVSRLRAQNPNIVNALTAAQTRAQETVDWYNNQNFTDLNGNRLHFNTLKEWDDKCKAGGVIWNGQLQNNGNGFMFPVTQTVLRELAAAQADYDRVLGPAVDLLKQAERQLSTMGEGLKDSIASLKALEKLLSTGDIEGAVMLLQSTRAKLMDAQLGTQIKAMQERNAQITSLNNRLTTAQQTLAGYSGTDTSDAKKAKTKEVGDLKTAIDSLNSDSQIDMIRTQSLVNKRNEAFDTLTNLLGKFQKTIDGIVGNYR
jgi:hypothetical protein